MFRLFFLLCWVGFAMQSFAQYGIPPIQNYYAKTYKAHVRNFQSLTDQRGFAYFANQNGVLEYDGTTWRLIKTNGNTVRCLLVDTQNRIYVGTTADFGYIKSTNNGVLQYESLSSLLPENERYTGTIWHIYQVGNDILFHAQKKVYRYDGQKIYVFDAKEEELTWTYSVDGKMFIQKGNFIMEYEKDKLKKIPCLSNKHLETVFAILPYPQNKKIFFSRKEGVMLYDATQDSCLIPLNMPQVAQWCLENQLYCAEYLPSYRGKKDCYALGSAKNGILIIDAQGNILTHLNDEVGLCYNNIYYLHCDRNGKLWVSTTDGISVIDTQMPLSFMGKPFNVRSKVHNVTANQDFVYIGTDIGTFFLDKNKAKQDAKNTKFELIEGTESQCWQAYHIGKTLWIAGGNSGIYQIENNKKIKAYPEESATMSILHSQIDTNLLFRGMYMGLEILRKDAQGIYKSMGWVKELEGDCRSLYEDAKGRVWVGTSASGVFRLEFPNGTKDSLVLSQRILKQYGKEKGFKNQLKNFVIPTSKGVYFSDIAGFYVYNEKKDRFEPTKWQGKGAMDNTNPNFAKEANNGNLWLVNSFSILKNEKIDSLTLKPLLSPALSVFQDQDSIFWIGNTDGLYCFDASIQAPKTSYRAYIRNIRIIQTDSILFGGSMHDTIPFSELPYLHNSLFFSFTAPSFYAESETKFRYQLEGYDTHWSAWTPESKINYTNLREGNYTFKVQAINVLGEKSEIATYSFSIKPPWYRTPFAYLMGIVALGMGIWATVKVNTKRLEADKKRLESIVEERTRDLKDANENILLKNVELEQQKEEIKAQAENLQEAYDTVRLLNEIGQKITSSLSLETIVHTVYEQVNMLMNAPEFGIGIYDTLHQQIVYKHYVYKGEKMPSVAVSIENKNRLSVVCFLQQTEICMRNISEEYQRYIDSLESYDENEILSSLICLPLRIGEKAIGVISVQSEEINAYTEYHLNIMRNIAVYTSIALDNSTKYEQIEDQQESITASITYAKRIQTAILPMHEEIQHHIPEFFILYKPRDIVSGDFYWFADKGDKIILAVADCTGHGVPGAFMSMIGCELLNKIVHDAEITTPNRILNLLHRGIRKALRQESTSVRDGMDIAVITLHKKDRGFVSMEYAGAMNPLYYVEKGGIFQEIKADKKAIGGYQQEKEERLFANHSMEIQQEMMVYICSDGFQDQFGGADNRKFMVKRLKQQLAEIAEEPCEKQHHTLSTTFEAWRGNYKQIDDVLLMGLRLKP